MWVFFVNGRCYCHILLYYMPLFIPVLWLMFCHGGWCCCHLVANHVQNKLEDSLDQSRGGTANGQNPHNKINYKNNAGLIWSINSQNIPAQVKFTVMQRAVATCLKINVGCDRKKITSLLDPCNQVTHMSGLF